jgi:arylsulfatase
MPAIPTMAQCFRDAGYQAFSVGKLHVYPQRSRIGFDDCILVEEGRARPGGCPDDWEMALSDRGYCGTEFGTGVSNNFYVTRPWHLPNDLHPDYWVAREMCRAIKRRDPNKPAFWHLSFVGPHPPMWPPADMLDLYRGVELDVPASGDWVKEFWDTPPFLLRQANDISSMRNAPAHEIDLARRAFYAAITHIDYQVRTIIGCLNDEGLIKNTAIMFVADHGDMLGDHGMWAKKVMYDKSTRVPLYLLPPEGDERCTPGTVDTRLCNLCDVMPTLLDVAGIEAPGSVEGRSLLRSDLRDHLYSEYGEGHMATRMVREGDFKLIYYADGNRFQLFNVKEDPREEKDLTHDATYRQKLETLQRLLQSNLYGDDECFFQNGTFRGLPAATLPPGEGRNLASQRGFRFP